MIAANKVVRLPPIISTAPKPPVKFAIKQPINNPPIASGNNIGNNVNPSATLA